MYRRSWRRFLVEQARRCDLRLARRIQRDSVAEPCAQRRGELLLHRAAAPQFETASRDARAPHVVLEVTQTKFDQSIVGREHDAAVQLGFGTPIDAWLR